MTMTNQYGFPDAIVAALERSDEDYTGPRNETGTRSVTELIGPPMLAGLRRKYRDQITEDVSEQAWRLLGTAVHFVVDKASPAHNVSELRLHCHRFGLKISGQIDAVDSDGFLDDYKVTSVWSFLLGDKPEWEAQLNLYDLLCRENAIPVRSGLRIIAILRDWKKSEKLKDPARYPDTPIRIQPVRRWTAEEQEDYLLSRIELHTAPLDLDSPAAACTASERWQSPDRWAVMKGGNKRASKVCDSESEAVDYIAAQGGGSYRIEKRASRPTRCLDYCECRQWCPFGRAIREE